MARSDNEKDTGSTMGSGPPVLAEYQRLLAEERHLGVVLGGDFNFEPGSPEYRALLAAGLRDTHMIASPSSDLYSYDPQQNAVVRQEELTMPRSLRQALASLPEAEQQRIVEGYRNAMSQARRIDYLFHMGGIPKAKSLSTTGTVRKTDNPLRPTGIRSLWRVEHLCL